MERKIKDLFKGKEHLLEELKTIVIEDVIDSSIEEAMWLKIKEITDFKRNEPIKVKWDTESEKIWENFDDFCKRKQLEPNSNKDWITASQVALVFASVQTICENHKDLIGDKEDLQWCIDFVRSVIEDGFTFKKQIISGLFLVIMVLIESNQSRQI